MADDLSAAPSAGASEPASAPADTGTATVSDAPKSESKPLSGREAAAKAISEVMSKSPSETDRAAAVLKEGVGADDKLDASHAEAVDKAANAEKAANDAAERAKKGWETRRANQEQAKADEKPAPVVEAKSVETKFKEPPQRFAPTAKAEWEKVPEAVRAEIDRALSENEKGILKYKESAQHFDDLAEYVELSNKYYNQPLKETLKNYADLDRLLHSDPLAAFEKLASSISYTDENGNKGNWNLKQLAQYIVDQDWDTFDNPQDDLQRRLEAAEKRIADFEKGQTERETQRVQQDRERSTQSITKQIEDFAKANARFDELWSDIELELHNPKFAAGEEPLSRLKKAYEKVERLNPAPSLSPPAPELPAQDTAAQTRRGTASVAGAPSGSNPAGKRPAVSSPREAARMALSKMGIGSGA